MNQFVLDPSFFTQFSSQGKIKIGVPVVFFTFAKEHKTSDLSGFYLFMRGKCPTPLALPK